MKFKIDIYYEISGILKMLVEIKGFRCYHKARFEFDIGITLIKGLSGVGKTTVFQAIYWCLYGGMRNIYNNTMTTKKCYVKITFDKKLIVYRQKRPDLLIVTIDGKDYKDGSGQCLINDYFGTKDIWKTCSYIEQKQRCGLLTGTNNERMEYLNKLSFSNDNPDECIEKINSRLKNITKEYEIQKTKYQVSLELFNEKLKKNKVSNDKLLPSQEYNKIKNTISELNNDISRHKTLIIEQQKLQGMISALNTQLKQIDEKLVKLKFDDTDYDNVITNIEKKININLYKIKNKIQLKKELSRINDELSKINVKDYENAINKYKISNDEMIRVKIIENKIKENTKCCTELNCVYDPEIIKKEIERIESRLKDIQESVSICKSISELEQLEKKFKTMNYPENIVEAINKQELLNNKYYSEFENAKRCLSVLICPYCDGSVRLINDKLEKNDIVLISKEEINNLKIKYDDGVTLLDSYRNGLILKESIDKYSPIISLRDKYESTNIDKLEKEFRELSGSLNKFKRVEYYQTEISSSYIQKMLDYKNLLLQYNTINKELLNYNDVDDNINIEEYEKEQIILKEQLSVLKSKKKVADGNNSTINNLKNIKSELLNKYEEYKIKIQDGLVPKLNLMEKEINQLKLRLEESDYIQKIMDMENELENKKKILVGISDNINNLSKLKQKAIDVECIQLQDTVNLINNELNEILTYFFNDPITVTLNLYKETKSKKIKQTVNLEILYKGAKLDSVNQLSGGEGDRISLALILALNKISNSPIILLDEVMTSFDNNLKELTIDTLRNSTEKNILVIDHGNIDGFYDNVNEI